MLTNVNSVARAELFTTFVIYERPEEPNIAIVLPPNLGGGHRVVGVTRCGSMLLGLANVSQPGRRLRALSRIGNLQVDLQSLPNGRNPGVGRRRTDQNQPRRICLLFRA